METAKTQILLKSSETSAMQSDTSTASHDGDDMGFECYACNATYCDYAALRNHKIEMRDREFANDEKLTHVFCHYCDQDFVTERAGRAHWDQVSVHAAPRQNPHQRPDLDIIVVPR